ncbi:MAG: MraY family glycosyltransferase [Desulfobacterales bacterium]
MVLLSTFLISTIATILLIPLFINLACKFDVLDFPDSRKIHCDPVPRIGGVAMALGALIPVLLWIPFNTFVKSVVLGSAVLVIFGLVDDIKNIGVKTKFAGQIIAALIVIFYGGLKIESLGAFGPAGFFLPNWLSIPLTLVIIVAVTNAINLSDGLDGLAGGVTLITFLCIGYLSYLDNLQAYEIISVALVGAIFGLLRYNTHPAIVFMGDSGSQFLGFAAITLSLSLARKSTEINLILVLLILGIPVIDTLSVIIQRILKGRSPFAADRNHLHHKIMNLGFYHSESVLIIYFLHATLVCLGFIFRYESAWFLLTLYIVFPGTCLAAVFLAERKGYKIKRFDFIDKVIKGHLRKLREENVIIKLSFKAVEVGFIFLLLFSCFLPRHIHIFFSLSSMAILGMILLTWQFRKEWTASIIEISTFLLIPFLVYLSEKDVAYLMNTTLVRAYAFSFGALTVFILLTLKFTRRKGFRTTPMDFLILFVALVVPYLPDEKIRYWQMGLVAAKIVVLFFAYEVLKGELRMNTKKLGTSGIMALMIICLRGFIG